MMKNTLILIFVIFSLYFQVQADYKTNLIDQRLDNIISKIHILEKTKQFNIYDNLINQVNQFKSRKKFTIEENYYLQYITYFFQNKQNQLIGQEYNTLVLRFKNDYEFNKILIQKQTNLIKKSNGIFIFRYDKNLNSKILKNSINYIKDINPDTKIFIDQEGGLIKRYIDFDYFTVENYLLDEYANIRYNNLTYQEKLIFDNLFSKNYFPGLGDIGKAFKKIEKNKNDFLDLVTYIRLKNLSDIGINTYGLILDLDFGNSVISDLGRSFSSDTREYKQLIDFFTIHSQKLGVFIYAKHFPGHGDGDIDTHDDILIYEEGNIDYLKQNIDLFEYFLESPIDTKKGLMVGHMYIPKVLKDRYNQVLNKADYLITDDLSMAGYQKSIGNNKEDSFFTTLNLGKFIDIYKLDLQSRINIID